MGSGDKYRVPPAAPVEVAPSCSEASHEPLDRAPQKKADPLSLEDEKTQPVKFLAGDPPLPLNHQRPRKNTQSGESAGLPSYSTSDSISAEAGAPDTLLMTEDECLPITTTAYEMPGRYQPVDPVSGKPVRDESKAVLAQGGMGRIICVFDHCTNREVVVKERLGADQGRDRYYSAPLGLSSADVRFLHEAKITARLEHPYIVPVYEIGQRQNHRLYYTMKKVKGKTLTACLDECESLAERMEYLPHFLNLCHAIAYAHDKGIIHRDIKPDNVMVGEFGETVVLDWGLAKIVDAREEEDADSLKYAISDLKKDKGKSLHGYAMGTPSFIPPEQARGELDKIEYRSDVYSLGAVLYIILAGEPPFKGESVSEVLDQVMNQEPPPIGSIEKRAPKELVELAATALKKERYNRVHSAKDMAEQIGEYLSGKFIAPPRGGALAWLQYLWREKRAQVLWAAAAVAALVFGLWLHFEQTGKLGHRISKFRDTIRHQHLILKEEKAKKDRLLAAILAKQADSFSGMSQGLLSAAQAVLLHDEPGHRARLYREATARPYGLSSQGYFLGSRCRFALGASGVAGPPICFTLPPLARDRFPFVKRRLDYRQRMYRFNTARVTAPWFKDLSFSPNSAFLRKDGRLLFGDGSGRLHHVAPSGKKLETMLVGSGAAIVAVAVFERSGLEWLAASNTGGLVFLLSGQRNRQSIALRPAGKRPVRFLKFISPRKGMSRPWLLAADGEALYRIHLSTGRIKQLARFCPANRSSDGPALAAQELADGTILLASSCKPGQLLMGRLKGDKFERLQGPSFQGGEPIRRIAFAAKGRRIALAMADSYIHIFDRSGVSRWSRVSTLAHAGEVTDIFALGNHIYSSGAGGFVKRWAGRDQILASRTVKPRWLPGEATDLNAHGWVLTRSGGKLKLIQLETGRSTKPFPDHPVLTGRLASDGWSILALSSRKGATRLTYIKPFRREREIIDSDNFFPGASRLWPLDRQGKTLVALSDEQGAFVIVDYHRGKVVGVPRKWGKGAIKKIISDVYNINIAVLYENGSVAVGGIGSIAPIWKKTVLKIRDLTTTTDSIWLVMADHSGGLWAAKFALPSKLLQPCAPGERHALSARFGHPSSCLAKPALAPLLALGALDKHRLLLVGRGAFAIYDLRSGTPSLRIDAPAAQRILMEPDAKFLLFGKRAGQGYQTAIWPTGLWLSKSPASWRARLEQATGFKLERRLIRPLLPREWNREKQIPLSR